MRELKGEPGTIRAARKETQSCALELVGVSKAWGGGGGTSPGVRDIDLQVFEGSVVCVVGPSGCGKSTLLNLCAGFEQPTSGTVRCGGARVDGVNVGIGYITQDATLFPWMTLRQNVEFPLEVGGVSADERHRRCDAYLEAVGLTGFGDHFPSQLSGGMKHRGALVRTMSYDPELVLMDEPFAGLDAPTRTLLENDLLVLLEERPKSVVFVTHDITEAIALGDRVVVLTNAPARIKQVFEVPFGRNRRLPDVLADPRFSAIQAEVWNCLRTEFPDARSETSDHVLSTLSQLPRRRKGPAVRRASTEPIVEGREPRSRRKWGVSLNLQTGLSTAVGRVGAILIVLALWQLASSLKLVNPLLFATPASVLSELVKFASGAPIDGYPIYVHAETTLSEMAIGYIIGTGVGLALAFALAQSGFLSRVLEPLIFAAYGIPKIALAPLFVLFLGIGIESKVGIVSIDLFFVIFINTFAGIRQVNKEFPRLAAIFGASPMMIHRKVTYPAALPSIFVGLKMGVPFALTGAIIGEFIAATNGLGWLVDYAANNFQTTTLFASIVVLVVVVWVLSQMMLALERKVLPWLSQDAGAGRGRNMQPN